MRENAIIAAQAQRQEAFQFFLPAFDDASLIEDAMVILDAVGLTPKADILVSELAHGERRLLELALAMAGEPCLLLLDEPMAGAGPAGKSAYDRYHQRLAGAPMASCLLNMIWMLSLRLQTG